MENNVGRIDFVIPWVDGSDPQWQALHVKYQHTNSEKILKKWNDGDARYRDWDLLRYWFRGVETFAPWVGKIHFVTCGQIPPWLNVSHHKLHLVDHRDYIPQEYLPTFSSHCIELNFHRIPGLAEQFVYFNDDMFLTKATAPKDFFQNGLPRDSAILKPVQMRQNGIRAEINDMYVINQKFRKNDCICKTPGKWFSPLYGKYLLHTLLLLPYQDFTGFHISHLPISYRKNTLEEVWAAFPEILENTCQHKFRTSTDVNQWLFQYWQYAKGDFIPRGVDIGRMYEDVNQLDAFCKDICSQRYQMVCWNDPGGAENFDFAKQKLQTAFASILPSKSTFELY